MRPPRLCRYRPLGLHAERELHALRGAYLWAPRFSEMNDPMEASYQFGGTGDGLIDAMLGVSGKSARMIYDMARSTIDQFCLVSFSTSASDLPLWAYYGDSHAGICLEFDTDWMLAGAFRGEPLVQVEYAEAPLASIPFHEVTSPNAIQRRLSRKPLEWAHEKEWRVLTGQGGAYPYLDQALVRIHLGSRIRPEHAAEVHEIFRDRPTDIVQRRINGFKLSAEISQRASAPVDCERVGHILLNLDDVLTDRAEIQAFLDVPIEQLEDEIRSLAAQPSVEAISDCALSGSRPALYIHVDHRLRDGRIVSETRYYDAALDRLT